MSKQTAMHLNFANFNYTPSPEKRIDINYPNSSGEGIIIEGIDTEIICSSMFSPTSSTSTAISIDGVSIPENEHKVQCVDNTSNKVTCNDAQGNNVPCCPNCNYDSTNISNLCGPMVYYDESSGRTPGWYCPTENTLYTCDPLGACTPMGSDHSLNDCATHCKKKYWCDNKTLNSTICYNDPEATTGTNLCKNISNHEKFLPDPSSGIEYGTGPGQMNPCDLTKQFVILSPHNSAGVESVPVCAMINGWDCANTAEYLGTTPSGCNTSDNIPHTKGCRRLDSSLLTDWWRKKITNDENHFSKPGFEGELPFDYFIVPPGVKMTGYRNIPICESDNNETIKGYYDNECTGSSGNFCNIDNNPKDFNRDKSFYSSIYEYQWGARLDNFQGYKFELGSLNASACEGWNTPDGNGIPQYISPASEGEKLIAGNDGSISCSDYCKNHTDYKLCVDGYLNLDNSQYEGGALGNEYYQRPFWPPKHTEWQAKTHVGCNDYQVPMEVNRYQKSTNKWYYKQICRCTNVENKFCPAPNKIKNSNNGTVSCDTFCAGQQWEGFSGNCHSAIMGADDKGWQSVDCSTVANPSDANHCGNDGKCLHCCCT